MRKMKNSGIEWIGEIPEKWNIMRLKYLFSLGKGLSITKENLQEEGVPVISYGQVHSKLNIGTKVTEDLLRYVGKKYLRFDRNSLVNKGDFIFADTSEDLDGCGNFVYIDTQQVLFSGYHTIILKSIEKSDNKYYAYLFLTDLWRRQIREMVSGIKVYSISQKILSTTTVIVPSTEEQHSISTFLDFKCSEIDALVSDIEKQITALEQYKRSVITEAVTKGLDPTVPMKDSGIEWIGEIPSHWGLEKLKYKTKVRSESGKFFPEDKYIGLENVESYTGSYLPTDTVYDEAVYDIYRQGDILFGKLRPYLAKVFITEDNGFCTGEFAVIKDYKGYLRFLFYYLLSDGFLKIVNASTYGAKMPRANWDFIKNLPVPTIPSDEERCIADYLDSKCSEIDSAISLKKQQIKTLIDYKKSLIYEYVTGKKEIPA